jgi:hypothetical protein
MGQGLPYA